MNKKFVLPPQIQSRIVAGHRKARIITLKVERYTRSLWSPIRRLICNYFRRHEMTALHAVATSRPAIPDEAREKLLYLMALTIADSAEPGKADMDAAIETLRPFQAELAGLWEPDRSPSDHASQ